MKVLVIGSGGREHALIWKISQSPLVDKIYCAPGNGGTKELAINININVMEFDKLADFAESNQVDLTVVGPDDPLVAGIVDIFEQRELKIFGPRKNAAIIEGSKAFSKELMKKYNIPTAGYEVFSDANDAISYLKSCNYPIVLKADGLALGKGVLICMNEEEAKAGVTSIMIDKNFGLAGDKLVVEEFMEGREVSVLAFCDGKTIKPMTSAQDHKRAKDFDKGLNTGGMGAFSPSPFYTQEVDEYCKEHIYQKTLDAMKAEGREFVGILFVGLMLTKDGPKVLEYNARFGDPETQVVLPRMKNDIIPVILSCIEGCLENINLEFTKEACVSIVLASAGYPEYYEKGYEIKGLDSFRDKEGYYVFHAGTAQKDGKIVTAGGRVLGVTALGKTLIAAKDSAYEATTWIDYVNKYMRKDIGGVLEQK